LALIPQAKQLITQKKKYNLKNVKFDTFLNFKTKKKYDIVIDGGFLYVTPDNIINQTFKKIKIDKSYPKFIYDICIFKKNSFIF